MIAVITVVIIKETVPGSQDVWVLILISFPGDEIKPYLFTRKRGN